MNVTQVEVQGCNPNTEKSFKFDEFVLIYVIVRKNWRHLSKTSYPYRTKQQCYTEPLGVIATPIFLSCNNVAQPAALFLPNKPLKRLQWPQEKMASGIAATTKKQQLVVCHLPRYLNTSSIATNANGTRAAEFLLLGSGFHFVFVFHSTIISRSTVGRRDRFVS